MVDDHLVRECHVKELVVEGRELALGLSADTLEKLDVDSDGSSSLGLQLGLQARVLMRTLSWFHCRDWQNEYG